MAVLEVLTYPNPFLRTETVPVESVDQAAQDFAKDLAETMYADGGVGLAATQVNSDLRVFAMDCTEERQELSIFFNPVITASEGEMDGEEGCLSFPGIYASVTRARKVTVEALDQEGKPFEKTYTGLEARCVQHELDHLNGKLFVDYLSPVKRTMLENKIKKMQKKLKKA